MDPTTPAIQLKELLAEKRLLKTRITKAKNSFLTMMSDGTTRDDICDDFAEFNRHHKRIREIFNTIGRLVTSDEDVDKYVDEEMAIKRVYRDTKKAVESYLSSAQIDTTFSTVFSQNTQSHVTPGETLDNQSPFKGFPGNESPIHSRVDEQDGSNDSIHEFLSIQDSKQGGNLVPNNSRRSSTPIKTQPLVSALLQPKSLPLNTNSQPFEPSVDPNRLHQWLSDNNRICQGIIDPELEKQHKVDDLLRTLEVKRYETENERRDLEFERRRLEEQRRKFLADQMQIPTIQSHPTIVTPLRLEPLSLPTFDGSYDKWETFRDMYESIVHNSHMTTVEKFQRLKRVLSGSAAAFVENVPISEANYHEVWKDVKDFYNNPRRIVASHVQAILNLHSLTDARSSDLRAMLDQFKSHMRALKTAGHDSNAEIFKLHILLSKLDPSTQQKWEAKLSTMKDIPTLQYLYDVIEKRIRMLEIEPPLARKSSKPEFRKKSSLHASGNEIKCHVCGKDHLIYKCPDLNKATPQERLKMTNDKRLCHNCFSMKHKVADCKSGNCRVKDCNQKHNTLLHDVLRKEGASLISTSLFSKFKEAVLATAIVIVKVNGQPHTARVLLDGGSQCNFITTALCHDLNLSTQPEFVDISGIGKSAHEINHSVQVTLCSHENDYSIDVSCLVMEDITERMPQERIDIRDWKIPSSTRLADPRFNKPGNIDILLSASVFFDALEEGIIQIGKNKPRLFKSKFGWLIAGGGLHARSKLIPKMKVCHAISKRSLSHQVEQFWSLEAFPEEEKVRSAEDEFCESHFVKTGRRVDSKFVVNLPFKLDPSQLQGDNRARAEGCWLATERKFAKDDHLRTLYNEFMSTYIKLGHMKETTDKIKYFIPHHHVYKPGTSEKKFRVVFNASSKTHSNVSLNDLLYVGPSIQDDLFNIILRFREHLIAIAGDIEKMYRQVLVDEKDQLYQGIVWRENQNQPLKSYRLCTLTYGTAPAAFIATRCIKRAAELDGKKFPMASKIIVRDFYMDDLLTSCRTESDAIELRRQVQDILDNSGLPMRKWISNSNEVLQSIPSDFRGIEGNLDMQMDETIKTLGMHWSPNNDQFTFTSAQFHDTHTKRTVISDIAKLFDPNGLLGPVVFKAKCIMQLLWKRHLSWDEALPQDLDNIWKEFKHSMLAINNVKIDRCLTTSTQYDQVHLFGFSDASELGYGACIYLVSTFPNHELHSRLVCSKSRVAPLKTQSIPRLELCGALLLAELITAVKKALTSKINQMHCFTDSKIVLSWISKEPATWKVFTANRVSKILTLMPCDMWFHVRSEDNPADLLSRGSTPEAIIQNQVWWHGPSQLMQNHIGQHDDVHVVIPNSDEDEIIMKEKKQLVHVAFPVTPTFIDSLFERKSKLQSIVRIVAYVKRFVRNFKTQKVGEKLSGSLSFAEIVDAQRTLARHTQRRHFPQEFHALEKGLVVPHNSKILSLKPVWDKELELIKVGGRIANAKLPEPRKHQVILPSDGIFTRRLFEMEHARLLHAGPQLMLNQVRNQWWPVNGKRTAQTVYRKCVTCSKRSPRMQTQVMGDLPECRLTPSKCFMSTALDFAGPFKTKQNEGPRCKKTRESYICIFVCCSTKAIHLEVVSSYTSAAFIACLRRFVSNRGKVRHIYCDNGTNFVGANNMLRKMMADQQDAIHNEFDYIDFHFAPARSPHTGGLYEANVRSMKKHLNRVMGKMILNFEELQTLVQQIEACMNSRPICLLPSGPEEIKVLTPGHFLTGDSMTALPDVDYTDVNPNRLNRWCQLQHMLQGIWKVWSGEYFDSMQQRHKWKQPTENLQPGDIVMIKEENVKPLHWRMGRVTQVFPDKHGQVRTVELIVNKHITKRTVHKLCKLPIEDIPIPEGKHPDGNY